MFNPISINSPFSELSDTIYLMLSKEYKSRFKAEYYQLVIRLRKLDNIIKQYKEESLTFIIDCPLELLVTQSKFMHEYKLVLERRAELEKILI